VSRRAVFLDRDGVINRAKLRENKPVPPADVSELEILPGVPEALERLKAAGFTLVVVSNQPDVARGTVSVETVEAINARLREALPLDDFRICYHDNRDSCECRKPKPGLLLAAAASLDLDLRSSFLVGDRWRDIEAGRLAGCTTFFIDYGYAERQPEEWHYRVESLAEAAAIILSLPTVPVRQIQ
jgi:D-glycero-D-manno-heptose 1,7-bisphosphate phosphatase